MLRTFGHPVAICCDVLQHVGWCWIKFENGQIFRATFWMHVATARSITVAASCNNVARCCVELLRAFGQAFSNHDDDGNKNPTNLHIWQWKTVFLHVHASSFDILKTFSFFLRREMTCSAVVWTTWAYDDKCSILSYVRSAGSNLIPGKSEQIFQA